MAMRNQPRQGREHQFAQENLSAYIDRQLTAVERGRVARHLETCEACRAELSGLQRTIALISQAPRLHAPRSFALPRNMQPMQARQRRWEGVFAFARTAAVIASALTIVFLAGDVALSLSLGPMAPARSDAVAVTTEVVEYAAEAEEMVALESMPLPADAAPEAEKEAERAVVAAVEAASEVAADEAEEEVVAMQVLPTPDPRAPTPVDGLGGGVEIAAAPPPEDAPHEAYEQPEADTEVAAEDEPTVMHTSTEDLTIAAPTALLTEEPPTQEEIALAALREAPTEAAPVVELAIERTSYWQVWGWLRTLWLLSVGLVLILLGTLIWAAYRKRV